MTRHIRQSARPSARLVSRHTAKLGAAHGLECLTRETGGYDPSDPAFHRHPKRQRCPCCELVEAVGAFCTRCLVYTGAADWVREGRPENLAESRARTAQAARNRPEAPLGPPTLWDDAA
jgi:hypothetical protein